MTRLERVIAANVILGRSAMEPVDNFGDITVQHFVDLLSAAHSNETLDVLTTALVTLIGQKNIALDDIDAVVTPKLGNVLLGKSLAQRLSKPSGFVRNGILFHRYVETLTIPGSKLLLVDDVSSESKILTDCVRNAEAGGYTIATALTVVNRTEGNAAEQLKSRNVTLHSILHYGDRELSRLVGDLRVGS